jgi:hypothetical protein
MATSIAYWGCAVTGGSVTGLLFVGGAVRVETGALEAVVRDMLRPMLKEWLDQRLPEIVEELVTREIARLTGRDI